MSRCSAEHPHDPRLTCSINAGHDGTHQCYFGNQLHEWPHLQ